MRIPPALTLLPAIVLMAAGCAGEGADTTALADQADRVAQLLADEQPCAAAEALRALEALTDGGTRPEVREAVDTFVASARASTRCEVDTGSPEPAPSQAPPAPDPDRGDGPDDPPKVPPGQQDDGQGDDRGEDDGEDDGDRPGKGKGRDD